jgi:hypothetical protein
VEISEGEGERFWQEASGSPPSIDAKRMRQAEKGVLQILDTPREIPSRSPSLSWSACKQKGERREKNIS